MPRSPRTRSRRARRELAARLEALAGDEEVEVPCRVRRTTSRGWGSWVDGLLHLPAPGDGIAHFEVDDPSEVALVTRQGQAPVTLDPPVEVAMRRVRYKAETFFGAEAEIIVATSPRRTLEVALPATAVEAVARRLAELG